MKDEVFLKKLGKRIEQIRKENGLTQKQLAEKLGTFHTQIGRIERGEVNVTINSLRHLAIKLGVALEELVSIS